MSVTRIEKQKSVREQVSAVQKIVPKHVGSPRQSRI